MDVGRTRAQQAVPGGVDLHETWLPAEHPLHRPRHSARQRTALTCSVTFFLAPLLAFVLGARPAEIENRPLTGYPAADGWGMFTRLPDWATDHLPLRLAAVRALDGVSRGVFGEPPPAGQSQQPAGPLGPLGPAGPAAGGTVDRPRVDTSAFPAVIEGREGWMYLGQDITTKCAPARELTETIAALRRLRAEVESSGRRFILVVAPDKTTMTPQYLPDSYAGKDCAAAASDEFWRRVPAETGALDLRPPLRDVARQRGPVYDRSDSHWTYEGGVVLTYALANQVAPRATATWAVTPARLTPWPADIPFLLGRDEQRLLQAYDLAPDGTNNRTNFEPSDFREAKRYTSTPTTGTIDLPVGMIADSFTQFASPYLAAVFTDLTIVHPETVGSGPRNAAAMLAEKEVIVLELAERRLADGAGPLLLDSVIDEIGRALRARPVR